MDACGRESITRQFGKPFHLEPRDPSFVSYINQRASYAIQSSIQVLRTCPERYSAVRPVHTSEANVRMRACVSGHMSMVEIWLVHLGHSWTWINGSQNRQGARANQPRRALGLSAIGRLGHTQAEGGYSVRAAAHTPSSLPRIRWPQVQSSFVLSRAVTFFACTFSAGPRMAP